MLKQQSPCTIPSMGSRENRLEQLKKIKEDEISCSTILFVSKTKLVVVFYLIFASLSRSSLELGPDWEVTHFCLKLHYHLHLKCSGEYIVQQWTRKIGDKNET